MSNSIRSSRRFAALLAVAALSAPAAAQSVVHVDDDARPGGDGSSWRSAFRSLQDALAAARPGDRLHMAGGVYTPDRGAGVRRFDRDATFTLADGTRLLGGFRGLEGPGDPDERDPRRFPTRLSGDLRDDDPRVDDNSRHVATVASGAKVRLDGVVLERGHDRRERGANLRARDGDTTLVDCVIRHGVAGEGGGILLVNGRLEMIDVRLEHNAAAAGDGGALRSLGAEVRVVRATIRGNSADRVGGGLALSGGTLAVIDSLLSENRAAEAGAADVQQATFLRCRIAGNEASDGAGGIRFGGRLHGRSHLLDSLLHGNRGDGAGALHLDAPAGGARLEVLGCTIVENLARGAAAGAGIRSNQPEAGALAVANTILWGNDARLRRDEAAQLVGPPGAIAIDYSDVQGWSGSLGGVGNFGADPSFVRPALGDWRLRRDSPCLDAGDPAFEPAPGRERDADGNCRLLDADFDRVDVVDLGAFEFTHVRLAIEGIPHPGRVVSVVLDGTRGLPTILVVGTAPGIEPLRPLGTLFIDLSQPTVFLPWPGAPSRVDLRIPFDLAVPETFVVQAFVEGRGSGNLSNPELVRVR